MTVDALDARHAHQRAVADLLDELEERRRRLYRLKARGVRLAGARDLASDLEDARRRLLDTVGA